MIRFKIVECPPLEWSRTTQAQRLQLLGLRSKREFQNQVKVEKKECRKRIDRYEIYQVIQSFKVLFKELRYIFLLRFRNSNHRL
jgi:hypothetical protein